MELAVIAAFVAFLGVNLALGLCQGRGVRTVHTFILGRRLTTGVLLLTLVGTLIGGEYLTNWFRTGSLWGGGWLFLWVGATVSMGLVLTFYVFPKLRKYKGWYTLGDIARQDYGSVYAGVAVDGISLISSVILLSAQLVGIKRITGLLGFGENHTIGLFASVSFSAGGDGLCLSLRHTRSGKYGCVADGVGVGGHGLYCV